jgi:pimeloyl-ACP methyl ester carboxylesterase
MRRFAVALLALLVLAASSYAVAAQIPKAPAKFAKLDGARIYYVDEGKGKEAIVLVHGWTCNQNNWHFQIPAFAERARVIALDLPGHGMSDKPEINYSMDLFARAIDAVMRDAGVERAVLVGHSMGTPVVRQFYRKYPEKTLALVIVDGGLRPFADKAHRDGFVAMFRAPNYKEAGAQMFKAMLGSDLSAEDQERVNSSFLNTPQHVIVSAAEAMNDDTIYAPDKINVPVLAVLAKSPFWADDTEQFFRSLAPKLEYHMWEGVHHFVMLEKPKEFNETVIAFLNKNGLLKPAN